MFGPYEVPDNISEEDREELGIPAPEFPRLFMEAVYALEESEFNVARVDATQLAEDRAELKALRAADGGKRHERKWFYDPSGNRLFRAMITADGEGYIISQDSLDAIRNS
ncbi:hypothetical protein BST17_24755 [Mycolicibacterium bacteremicum]|uniref:Uncharacterized protein n=1 Tax=Mycolicibacterium bacteremicum TaxID=564198 RepID=A0A1W9YQ17_MYCBA|nr:hypothetical protein BST17_24755 [Mycolicibacterium bacteremicum]